MTARAKRGPEGNVFDMTAANGNTAITRPLMTGYGAQVGALPGQDLPWLAALRETAAERYLATGLPTPKWEDWKFTSLRPLEGVEFSTDFATDIDIDLPESPLAAENPLRVVVVNGVYRADLSDAVDGLTVTSLSQALKDMPELVQELLVNIGNLGEKPFMALNTAWIRDGFLLHAAKNAVIDRPVEVVFYGHAEEGKPVVYHPRNMIVVEEGADVTLFEHHCGQGVYFANSVNETNVKDNAKLRHYRLQDESKDAFHMSTTSLTLGRDASYDSTTLTTGARLSRHDVHAKLINSGSYCNIDGLYLICGMQHSDNTILVDHFEPHCHSSQNFKGVIDDKARSVFQGKIRVSRDAQKSDGHQSNHAILLSEEAEIDSKPELEIYADDVKCSHGATAGQLDDASMFYLRSRGIPASMARALLIQSFLSEVVEKMTYAPMRETMQARVEAWLGEHGGTTDGR